MKRTSYQQGSVVCKPRKRGPDVWVFRYLDENVQKSIPIGTVVKFKTKAAARKEADKLRAEINERLSGLTVSGLCDRFKIECEKGGNLRPHSIETYKSFAKRVRAESGELRVDELVKDVETIERWINDFQTLGTPDRVIQDRTAKGKLIPSKVVPAPSCQQEDEAAPEGLSPSAVGVCDEVENHTDAVQPAEGQTNQDQRTEEEGSASKHHHP